MAIKKFEFPSTWGKDKNDFVEVLLEWFFDGMDYDVHLYDWLAEKRDKNEHTEKTAKFEKLYLEHIEEWSEIGCSHPIEWYEKAYQLEKEEFEEYMKRRKAGEVS